MPTYDYDCSKCGIVFECYQSMKDDPLSICIHPEGCKHPKAKAKVQRLIGTGAGLIFKGSGFYITDYRSQDYREAAKKEGAASGNGKESSSSGKDGSAPAKKAAPEPAKAKSD